MKRVVCGKSPAGQWSVLQRGEPTSVYSGGGFVFTDHWSVDELSLDPTDITDQTSITDIYDLAPGASRFRTGVFPPLDAPEIWHRTDTIDYEYIVSGEIDLLMEDGTEVHLEAGDTNIQLGGTHQWWNRSGQPCVMVIVMIGVASTDTSGTDTAATDTSGTDATGTDATGTDTAGAVGV